MMMVYLAPVRMRLFGKSESVNNLAMIHHLRIKVILSPGTRRQRRKNQGIKRKWNVLMTLHSKTNKKKSRYQEKVERIDDLALEDKQKKNQGIKRKWNVLMLL